MRETHPLYVDVSELLRRAGRSKKLSLAETIPGLALDMGGVGRPLELDLLLESVVDGILVTGRVRGTYELECSRCARAFEAPIDLEMSEVYPYPGAGGEEGYRIEGECLPLEPAVRDLTLLGIPMKPLCRPDCRGLCPVCGLDRNASDCGHAGERTYLRWEPLAKLREEIRTEGE